MSKWVLFQGFWDSVHDKCVINVDDQAALSLAQPGNGFGHEGAKGGRGKSHNGKSLRGTAERPRVGQEAYAKDDEREEDERQNHKGK